MKTCYNCRAEILYENLQFCEHCGADLSKAPAGDDDRLEFEVNECHSDTADAEPAPYRRPASDTLGIQSDADLLEAQATDESGDDANVDLESSLPAASAAAGGSHKLSSDEIKNIEKHLYASAAGLSDKDRLDLIKKMSESGKTRIARGGSSDLPRPAMAKRGRGIAYFVKNFVQIQGEVSLREDDELVINERTYVLRKKPLTPNTVVSVAAAVFLVLAMVFIPILVRDAHVGQGEIVGVVLDNNHQPITGGAVVRFPESGQSFTTDGQGFFNTGPITPGTHRIDYLIGSRVVATDYATVTAGEVTTLSLVPGADGASETDYTSAPAVAAPTESEVSEPATPTSPPPAQAATAPRSANSPDFGRVTLAANIDGARFQVDGVVLGLGNLTYNKIRPGAHTYSVTKDGYQPVSGSITVSPGQTEVLTVALAPSEQREIASPSSDYDAAVSALKSGNITDAINGFSNVLSQQPQSASAYAGRGAAYALSHDKSAACADYLRAAEIYRTGGNAGEAIKAYGLAATADPKSADAYLGRANIYLASNEEIAAIADYETVLKLDKKNSSAMLGLGEARLNQGNYKQAIKHFRDARSADPNNPLIYQYLMLCYFGDDDLKNVRKSYDKFQEIATQEQLARLHSDKDYAAMLRIVQTAE